MLHKFILYNLFKLNNIYMFNLNLSKTYTIFTNPTLRNFILIIYRAVFAIKNEISV